MYDLVTIVGYACIGFFLWFAFSNFAYLFRLYVFRRMVNGEANFVEKFGPWAVITGSTDGIGKAYAVELAKRGINVVLISRNKEKLEKVAEEMSKEYNVQTKTIVADFAEGLYLYEHIRKDLENMDVGILVNNVGSLLPLKCFDDYSSEYLWQDVNININSMLQMTDIILPRMKKRRRGTIVNVSSASNETPLPFFSLYTASKVYIKYFSLALQQECKSFGVTIQLLSPAFVRTKLSEFSASIQKHPQFLMPSSEVYAKQAVQTLGICDDTAGYFFHDIEYSFLKLMPMKLKLFFSRIVSEYLRNEYLSQQSKVLKSE